MTASEGSGPQDPRRHPAPDPLAMSPAEKVAAEWEARHDVAARGHRGTPGAVQHYLAESRTREAHHSGAHHSGGHTASAVPPSEAPPAAPAGGRRATAPGTAPRRRWWPFSRRR
ncbi:hypothetical protein [Modestobacter sp. VKM Ac-2985]|uniref:hypothetical protein n=1 Tax=Modestobacter sp. VKM Ac-2985 TaxID=3004139 RepID=UPI0022AB8A8F|nr:hypothetical protein [Modestobacter sp. VKM Ac-2985]MCZ2839153.1 hypothetical protein [Modestobacter sp. VKM Ac-2985]